MVTKSPSSSDLERKAAQKADALARENENLLKDSLESTVQVKDGKLFGIIPIAKEFETVVNTLLAPTTVWLSESVSKVVHNQAEKIFSGSLANKHAPHIAVNAKKYAMWAELGTMWAILGLRPLSEFISANKNYTFERYKLGNEIKSICEATGADAAHNEVIRAAKEHLLQERYITPLKMLAPGLLTFAASIPKGLESTSDIIANRGFDPVRAKKMVDLRQQNPSKTEEQIRLQIETDELKEFNNFRKEKFKEYFENESRDRISDKQRDKFDDYVEGAWKRVRQGKSPTTKTDAESKFMGALFGSYSLPTIAGMFGQPLEQYLTNNERKNGHAASSYKLIKDLESELEGGRDERHIRGEVIKIFQQLEEDMGRTRFAGGLLEKLAQSVKPISEAIAAGKLDALSLIKFAGEHKVIDHTGGKRAFRSKEAIENSIEEMCCTQVIKEHELSEEEFFGRLAHASAEDVRAIIKKNIAEMDDKTKDLFAALTSTDVLTKSGMSKDQIREHRKNGRKHLYEWVATGILHIAAQNPDVLQKHGLSSKEIQSIQQLSKHIVSGDMEAVKTMVDSGELGVIVGSELLAEQLSGEEKIWTEIVGRNALEKHIDKIKESKEKPDENSEQEASKEHSRNIQKRSHYDHAKAGRSTSGHELGASA